MSFFVGSLIAVSLFVLTYYGKHLTLSGAAAAAIIIALFSFIGLWEPLILLLVTYAAIMLVDKVTKKKRVHIEDNILNDSGARSAKQILVNGLAALLSIIFLVITDNRVFLIVFAVGTGETFADSIASDVGVLSKRLPRDICTWKQISPGLSGGVSLPGIAASVLASVFFGTLAYLIIDLSFAEMAIVALFSFGGSIVDSILGSRVQAKYQCSYCEAYTEKRVHCQTSATHIGGFEAIDNNAVNLLSNLTVCGLCLVLYGVM